MSTSSSRHNARKGASSSKTNIVARYGKGGAKQSQMKHQQHQSDQQENKSVSQILMSEHNPVHKLQKNFSRYVRTNDRRMMMKAMKDCRRLSNIPIRSLDTKPLLIKSDTEWKELETEVSKSKITLNGITFTGRDERKRREAMQILKKLCEKITEEIELSSEQLFQELLVRMGRDTMTEDIFSQIDAILGCPDLAITPPKKTTALPIELNLYESGGSVHAVCWMRHLCALFRKSDLSVGQKRPWVRLTLIVYERVNVCTGQSTRCCSVEVME